MIKLPGMTSGLSGAFGEAGGLGAPTIGTALRSPSGGVGQATQENSDLSKVVEDLLHDKLMDKMGGAGGGAGGGASPLGGLQLPEAEGGHGPMVPQQSFGGLQAQGGQSLQGAQKENGDLMKLVGDLLKSRTGGAQGTAAQPQQSGVQGENNDLMKMLQDLLEQNTDAAGDSGDSGDSAQAGDPASMLQQMMAQNQKMKSLLDATQSMMQST